jgi:predicted MPP superfamily phosphohydrolase
MSIGIVHISDLHLSTKDAKEIFTSHVINDIREFKPKLVIVTGDLVDDPDKAVFEEVRGKLEMLCTACGVAYPDHLVVVPGNHDYRRHGVMGRKATIKGSGFEETFPNWQRERFYEINGQYFSIFCFDSNTNDPRINLARGRVGSSEYGRFRKAYGDLQSQHNTHFDKSFKIAVLHHHPLPIAQTETGWITDNDAFLGLDDAGTFMQEMVENRIDLVLHGHKHFPFFARTKFITAAHGERELTILAAGSTCKPAPGKQGNGYNLITLKDNKTIEVEQRFRDTPGGFKLRQRIPVMTYEMHRERQYYEELCRSPYSLELEKHNILINEDGDSECLEEFRNFRVLSGCEVQDFPISSKTVAGTFKGFSAYSRSDAITDPAWKLDDDSTDTFYKGRVDFRRPLTYEAGPISFDTCYYHFNAFALDAEQGERLYGDKDPEYYVNFVGYPIGTLLITIRFPSDIKSSSFDVVVLGEDNLHDTNEEEYCRRSLHISELTSTATLIVSKPLSNHSYGICWQLPPKEKKTSPQDEGNAKLIRKQLLGLNLRPDPSALSEHPLKEVFKTIRKELLEQYPSRDPSARFDIALMVYDDNLRKLRPVAGVMPSEYWDFRLHEGEGVAGRAHKLNSALLYIHDMVKDDEDWYISPPNNLTAHEVVFAVPLRYPIPVGRRIGPNEGSVIGVLCIGTTSPGSGLLRLYDITDEEREGEGDKLIAKIHEDYLLKRILPALGIQHLT